MIFFVKLEFFAEVACISNLAIFIEKPREAFRLSKIEAELGNCSNILSICGSSVRTIFWRGFLLCIEYSLRRLARPAFPLLPNLRQHRRQKLAGVAARRLD